MLHRKACYVCGTDFRALRDACPNGHTRRESRGARDYELMRCKIERGMVRRNRTKGKAMSTAERINMVASGETINGVVIYWDSAAVGNEGPAYRDGDESGPLEFAGWAGLADGSEDDTYHVSRYFGVDGRYLGPDQYGVYPRFEA